MGTRKSLVTYNKSKKVQSWDLSSGNSQTRIIEFDSYQYNFTLGQRDFLHLVRVNVLGQIVRQVIEDLPENQKHIILDYYWGEMTLKDIASTRGVDPSTVSRAKKRAEATIRDVLKYYYKLDFRPKEDFE